jgi:hypothetical protein
VANTGVHSQACLSEVFSRIPSTSAADGLIVLKKQSITPAALFLTIGAWDRPLDVANLLSDARGMIDGANKLQEWLGKSDMETELLGQVLLNRVSATSKITKW